MNTAPALEEIAEKLTAASRKLGEADQRIALGLIRQLAEGAPVEAATLAERLQMPEEHLADALDRLPGVYRDEQERVTGYFGLTVVETGEHRLHVEGRALSAWCAWDTLFLPELIGADAKVTSRSPNGGEEISLTVTADGPSDVTPAEAVVSFLLPKTQFGQNSIASFCQYVHFFASRRSASAWSADRPGTFVLSIQDAYELGRIVNHAVFGHAITTT